MIARLRLIFVVFAVGGPLAAAVWWYRARPPELPLLPQAVADPEIARAIEKAHDEVLRKPESGPARGALGMVLLAHDYPDAAAAYLEQAARMEPKEPSWPYFLALTRQADPEAAIEWLKRSADLADRVTLVPRTVLGEVYLQQGQLDEAEEAFKFVKSRIPDDRRARLGLARVSVARGQLDSAVTLLERMGKEQPTRKDVLSLLAQVHSRRNAPEVAEAVRTRAAALPDDPAWPDPFRNMLLNITVGKLFRIHKLAELNQAGRQQEAYFLSRELMSSHPDLASSAEARWERSQGNFTAAESAYRKTIELTPSSTNLAGLGSQIQLTATGNYSNNTSKDISQRATYSVTITQNALDTNGAALPEPPAGVQLIPGPMITAVTPPVCTWFNQGTTSAPIWVLTGTYTVTATFNGVTSNPVYISVASAAGAGGLCGPTATS